MNEDCLLTVAVAFYNDENHIEQMIKSVINQTYTKWKMILMDDGSNDNSLRIAKKYEKADRRISVLSDGKNYGLQHRLNLLIDKCETKYFARMDSDDIMVINRLATQLKFLEQHQQYDVVGSNAYSLSVDNTLLGLRNCSSVPKNYYKVFRNGIFIHPTVMGKLNWFKKNKYCEEKYAYRAEDYELWCRTYSKSNFFIIDEPLLFYRENASVSKSIFNTIDGLYSILKIIKKDSKKSIGYINSWKLYIFFYEHIIINYILLKLGFVNYLMSRRYSKLSIEEEKNAKLLLDRSIM